MTAEQNACQSMFMFLQNFPEVTHAIVAGYPGNQCRINQSGRSSGDLAAIRLVLDNPFFDLRVISGKQSAFQLSALQRNLNAIDDYRLRCAVASPCPHCDGDGGRADWNCFVWIPCNRCAGCGVQLPFSRDSNEKCT